MRTHCAASHFSQDDPILYPGQNEAAHPHIFFGNSGIDESTTPENIRTRGRSTCPGGTLNMTGYWFPAIFEFGPEDDPTNESAEGDLVHEFYGIGPHTGWSFVGDVTDGNFGLNAYYKTGYEGVAAADVQAFPAGLRIIAGDPHRTTPTGLGARAPVTYACVVVGNTGPQVGGQESIPWCQEGTFFSMIVRFPQCWDGVRLWAENSEHMAYGLGWPDLGCPASHPVALPEITMHMQILIEPGMDTRTWRLASDTYVGPAGYSGHADWFNGWDPDTLETFVANCLRPALDCHNNLLGNGLELGTVHT
jgi:hypothetical protein